MTLRHANWLFLIGFMAVGAYYLHQTYNLAGGQIVQNFDLIRFPLLLGVLLVALCLLELVNSIRRRDPEEDAVMALPNLGKILGTVALTALFIVAWWWTRQFYLVGVVFFFALVMLYAPQRNARAAMIAAAVSVGFMVALYLIFSLALDANL